MLADAALAICVIARFSRAVMPQGCDQARMDAGHTTSNGASAI